MNRSTFESICPVDTDHDGACIKYIASDLSYLLIICVDCGKEYTIGIRNWKIDDEEDF